MSWACEPVPILTWSGGPQKGSINLKKKILFVYVIAFEVCYVIAIGSDWRRAVL
jgi:hypothetical protein